MTLAGDLIVKVVASFVTDGFRRGYHELKTTVRRRHSIDRALSGQPDEKDHRFRKAIADLEKVIGNAKGQLTDAVAAFIREVERSAIPEAIIRCVLTNGDPATIYPAFEIIHRAYSPTLPFDAKQFYDGFYTAIRLRAEQYVSDPGLLEFVQAQNKELSKQLSELTKALRNSGRLTAPLSSSEIADARLRLARSFENTNRYLTVETVQGAKRCRIKQLVVPPRLATVTATAALEARKARPNADNVSYASYYHFKTTVCRAVILGDPGGGKSTLTQLLCFDNSNSIILESNFPGKPEIDATELRVPLRIVLRSFDKRRKASAGYNLLLYLVDQIAEIFDNDTQYCQRLLRHFLSLGNALLIFDGLDEILEVDARREMVLIIEQFANTYAGCPAIITSRFVGYSDAPLSEDFSVYHLATFNQEEVSSFSYKFIKIIESLKKDQAQTKATRFLTQTNNIASDLRENPLMLGLMVYLFIYRGDVPSNRPEIYKECATLMFEKWDQRRDIIFKIPTDFDLLDLFSYLASKIFGSAETEDGVSREWLLAELRHFFENWYLDKAKALQSARSLVDFITGRAWVMYEVGPNVFKFTHRTFLEYFFARHLLSSSDSIDGLIRTRLLAKISNSEWDVIAHLALQMSVFRDAGKMIQAANTIMSILDGPKPTLKAHIARLLFVSKALEYLLLPETRYCGVIRAVCGTAIDLGDSTEAHSISVIGSLISSTRKRDKIAKDTIYEVIREKLKAASPGERASAMFTICRASDARSRWRRLQFEHSASQWQVAMANSVYFDDLRRDMNELNYARATESDYEAHLYAFTYGTHWHELFRRYGLGAFYRAGPTRVTKQMPDLILLAIEQWAAIEEERVVRKIGTKSESDAFALMRAVVEKVKAEKQIRIPHDFVVAPSLDIASGIIRSLFTVIAEAKNPNLDVATTALIALAVALDIDEIIHPPRYTKGDGPKCRFMLFMPDGPMEQMMSSLRDHPMFALLSDWNDRKFRFARTDSEQRKVSQI